MAGAHVGRGKSEVFRVPPALGQFSQDAGGCSFEYNFIRLSQCVTCWSVASAGNLGGGSFVHNG